MHSHCIVAAMVCHTGNMFTTQCTGKQERVLGVFRKSENYDLRSCAVLTADETDKDLNGLTTSAPPSPSSG